MARERTLETLSNQDLDEALLGLVATERACVADILAHLAEVDERQMYLADGYASLFAYATERLGMTRAAGGHRITAARLLARFPVIHRLVASGALHLAGIKLLSPYITEANHVELLAAASGKSKRAIEELLAARYPRADVLPLVVAHTSERQTGDGATVVVEPSSAPVPSPEPSKDVREARPVSADSYAITFTIDRACKDKLAEAQALLSHRLPSGGPGAVMSLALDALLAKVRKERFAVTDSPRAGRDRKAGARYVPAEVSREVRARDGERCAFVAKSGHRCTDTHFIEQHHVHAHGKGGPPTVDNLQMLCRAHNNFWAEVDYGKDHLERMKAAPRVPADLIQDAKAALLQLGFSAPISRRAVSAAAASAEQDASLEQLIRESLRQVGGTRTNGASEPQAQYRTSPGARCPAAHHGALG